KGRPWTVEVGQQRVDPEELEAGRDEELSAPRERRAAGKGLERAGRRRADGEDSFSGLDPPPGFRRDFVPLAVDSVLLEPPLGDGAERVEPDVQGHALDVQAPEELRREMEACG